MFSDLLLIINWWVYFFLLGIIFLPITILIFQQFLDKGYIFSKVIGMLFVSYSVFLLGTTKFLPFTQLTIFIIIAIFFTINIRIFFRNLHSITNQCKQVWPMLFLEESMFFCLLVLWSFIRGTQPDIHGLEKYMDFGFVNAILRSNFFPPPDMWFTPFPINYYYFGHLITAVLTKLSGIPSSITYNLMIATLFTFTFTQTFSIVANLIYFLKPKIDQNDKNAKRFYFLNFRNFNLFRISNFDIRILIGGVFAGFLTALGGNLHTIYTFFKPYINESPVPFWELPFLPEAFSNSYWYPNATRFIRNTIHEFPLYSFVVSDLHGHVLDIPFVLLIIAILFSLISKSQILNPKQYQNTNVQNYKRFVIWNFGHWNLFRNLDLGIRNLLLISFLLAIMYMTNAWDGIIYALLTFIVFFYLAYQSKNYTLYAIRYMLIIIGFIIFSLPFSLNFKPFVSGIGVLCAPDFLIKIGKIGPLLFEADHCQHSLWWQLLILHGFFYFWIISFIFFLFKNFNFRNWNFILNLKLEIRNLATSDIFVLLLIFLSTLLIIIPEFIYAKDIYPAHYRANTMFKLVYQAFIMLSLCSAYSITRIITNYKLQISQSIKQSSFYIIIIGGLGLFFVGMYPYFAINSYYGNFQRYYGIDGIRYLNNLYPTDYEAIIWINKNIKGNPVILEAQGDSYTDYARVSANTGLPTVLGWTVHEWLWRGSYDIPAPRINEIKTLYETKDIKETKQLITKHNIKLIFLGDLERQKYPLLDEEKFKILGKVIYQDQQTKIYALSNN